MLSGYDKRGLNNTNQEEFSRNRKLYKRLRRHGYSHLVPVNFNLFEGKSMKNLIASLIIISLISAPAFGRDKHQHDDAVEKASHGINMIITD